MVITRWSPEVPVQLHSCDCTALKGWYTSYRYSQAPNTESAICWLPLLLLPAHDPVASRHEGTPRDRAERRENSFGKCPSFCPLLKQLLFLVSPVADTHHHRRFASTISTGAGHLPWGTPHDNHAFWAAGKSPDCISATQAGGKTRLPEQQYLLSLLHCFFFLAILNLVLLPSWSSHCLNTINCSWLYRTYVLNLYFFL